jgi:streptogrisin C
MMKTRRFNRPMFHRLRRNAVALAVTLAVTSIAMAATDEPRAGQEIGLDRERAAAVGEAAVLEALQRDLGLSEADAQELLEVASRAERLEAALQAELGPAYGGLWLDHQTGRLTVGVTDPRLAEVAHAAGVDARSVTYNMRELEAIKAEMDALVEEDSAAFTDLFAWGVDVPNNRVVLTVREGRSGILAPLANLYGDALRIEESDSPPRPAHHPWLDGGITYTGCSVGFNARNTANGLRYFLTAGHCGAAGMNVFSHGIFIGPIAHSWFPGLDMGLVRVSNTASWFQGPWVWTYPGITTVRGSFPSVVGLPVCKSGKTTKVTCGIITATNQTVYYPQGLVVGLTRHTACLEKGDSGGSNFYWTSSGSFAMGMSSGFSPATFGGIPFPTSANPWCREKIGLQNISWFQPIGPALNVYGSAYGITLWTQ